MKFTKSDIREIQYQIKLIKLGKYRAELTEKYNIRLISSSGKTGRLIYTHSTASDVDKYLKAYIFQKSSLVKDLI